jgi:hypothetical protein
MEVMTNREKTDLVRACILQTLRENGDLAMTLTFDDLNLDQEMGAFFAGSISWLENENLISIKSRLEFLKEPPEFLGVQLSQRAQDLLRQNSNALGRAVAELAKESVKDVAKEGIRAGINTAVIAFWAVYIAWKATP